MVALSRSAPENSRTRQVVSQYWRRASLWKPSTHATGCVVLLLLISITSTLAINTPNFKEPTRVHIFETNLTQRVLKNTTWMDGRHDDNTTCEEMNKKWEVPQKTKRSGCTPYDLRPSVKAGPYDMRGIISFPYELDNRNFDHEPDPETEEPVQFSLTDNKTTFVEEQLLLTRTKPSPPLELEQTLALINFFAKVLLRDKHRRRTKRRQKRRRKARRALKNQRTRKALCPDIVLKRRKTRKGNARTQSNKPRRSSVQTAFILTTIPLHIIAAAIYILLSPINLAPRKLKSRIKTLAKIGIVLTLTSMIPTGLAANIKVATVNLGAKDKFQTAIKALTENQNPNIIFIQEDHMTYSEFQQMAPFLAQQKLKGYGHHRTKQETIAKYVLKKKKELRKSLNIDDLPDDLLVNPTQARATRGSCILVHKDIVHMVENVSKDKKFRTIYLTLRTNTNERYLLVNTYGPNEKDINDSYYAVLCKNINSIKDKHKKKGMNTKVIVGGDFNAVTRGASDYKIPKSRSIPSYKGLKSLMTTHKLTDQWDPQLLHEEKFTWLQKPYLKGAGDQETRIDTFLSDFASTSCTILPFNRDLSSDHRAVILELQISDIQKNNASTTKHLEALKAGFRPKYKTQGLSSTDLKERLKDAKLPHQNTIETILEDAHEDGLEKKHTLTSTQTAFELFIMGVQQIAKDTFGQTEYRAPTEKRQPKGEGILGHEGIRRLLELIDKLQTLRNQIQDGKPQEVIEKSVEKINETSNMGNLVIFTTENEYKTLLTNTEKRLKEIHQKLKYKEREMRNQEIQKRIDNCQNLETSNPKAFFKKVRGYDQTKEITNHITVMAPPGEQPKTPETLEEAIETNSCLRTKEGWTAHQITDAKEMLESATHFWQGVYNEKVKEYPTEEDKPLRYMEEPCKPITHFTNTAITTEEIKEAIDEAKDFKSPGSDGLGNEIWKNLPQEIKDILVSFITLFWNLDWVPALWKETLMVLLPKEGDLSYWANYRPISLLQCNYKIFTKVLYRKLMDHFHQNELIEPLQFGSKKDASITQATLTLEAVIEDAKKHNKKLYIASLDLTKAYDTVSFFLLEKTLIYYKVPRKLVTLIRTLYQDSYSTLYTPIGKAEGKINLRSGVKQGCGLSPLLWIIYINPLLTKLRQSGKGYKFANDASIHIPNVTFVDDINLIAESLEDLNELLDICKDFMKETGLRLNEKKTTIIASEPNGADTVIDINGQSLPIADGKKAYRFLGVFFTTDLNWDEQFNIMKRYLTKNVNRIRNKCYTMKQKIRISNAIFIPKINYILNTVHLSEEQHKELDALLTELVKHNCQLRKNHADCKIWLPEELGGTNLTAVKHINSTTFVANIINYGLNASNEFPRRCLERLMIDSGIDHHTLTNRPKVQGKGMTATLVNILGQTPYHLAKRTINGTDRAVNIIHENYQNTPQSELIYDQANHRHVFPIWTDGSHNPDTGNTSSALVLGKSFYHSEAWETNTPGSSFTGEIEAFEKAIKWSSSVHNTVIFVDSTSVNHFVNITEKKYSEQYKNPFRSYKTRITATLKHIAEYFGDVPEIIWIPSHIKEKLESPETSEAKKMKIKLQLEYLRKRFGNSVDKIIAGNEAADKIAGEISNNIRIPRSAIIPTGTPEYILMKGQNIVEGNINKILKGHWIEQEYQTRIRLTKDQFNNFIDFDLPKSNAHLKDKDPKSDKLFKWTIRLRNMALHTGDKAFYYNLKNSEPNFNSISNEIMHPTPICEHCNQDHNDYWHLFTCPKYKKTQNEIKERYNKVVRGLTNNEMVPYWWCSETERWYPPPYEIALPTTKHCKCETGEHGEYATCITCKKKFHPECLGISLPIDKLEELDFQCETCELGAEGYKNKEGKRSKFHEKPQRRGQPKPKKSLEVLITEDLQLSTIQNRRKRKQAEQFVPLFQRHKDAKSEQEKRIPKISAFKRANLGYVPKRVCNSLTTAAKLQGKTSDEVEKAIIEINKIVLEGGRLLYKEYIQENRKLRVQEGVNLRNLTKVRQSEPKGTFNNKDIQKLIRRRKNKNKRNRVNITGTGIGIT